MSTRENDCTFTQFLADTTATEAIGKYLARVNQQATIFHLQGELGAGKTTLIRGFLRELGYRGAVKSPTYTLVEPYHINGRCIYHFDLYRLTDPEELEYVGIRDYLEKGAVCFIEWAEKGERFIPQADVTIQLLYYSSGRTVKLQAGCELVRQLEKWF